MVKYVNDQEPYRRWMDLRRLDLSRLSQWLETNRPRTVKIHKIVSGGQTGVDRAALDWAIEHQIPHGGWCPTGRMAEDGPIDARYHLVEVPDGGRYRRRTKANVRDSDATLLITTDAVLSGGSKETALFAKRLGKPWLHVHPEMDWKSALAQWLGSVKIETLNVAGPRLSRSPNTPAYAWIVIDEVLQVLSSVEKNNE